MQPDTVLHVSVVHALLSSQLSVVPALHVPAWQVSAPLQALPSLHEVPFGAARFRQPSTASHESTVHGLVSAQLSDVPAAHTPAWQVSTPLHALPSVQELPSDRATLRHPASGSHESAVHGLLSLQL